MMLKQLFIPVIAVLVLLGLQACQNNINDSARVQLKLVDAPGDYLEVNIEIIDIQFNSSDNEESWTSFSPESGYPINVDLTELIAGNSLLLADQIIPSGILKQIRLVLNDNNTLVIEGEQGEPISMHLDTPSALQSGLKINLDENLEAGFSYTYILDWDVNKSIIEAGNSGNYILKPVIRANAEANSGYLKGNVVGEVEAEVIPLGNVTVTVYQEDTYIADSLTDENGNFVINGLSGGDYIIKIEHDGYDNYESDTPVTVIVGEISDVGTIEL